MDPLSDIFRPWFRRVLARLKTRRQRVLAGSAAAFATVVLLFLALFGNWVLQGRALAFEHARHEVSHKGWSFPARLYARENHAPAAEPFAWLIGSDGELREHLPIDEVPKHVLDAITAAEDRDFYEHSGPNFSALLRAVFANVRSGGYAQGGSTLTMQVVRALNQQSEKTLWRKLREVGLAVGVERAVGKRGVLQMYLDAPYLGQQGSLSICGFAMASKHYFGKDARQLSLAEAATLAAILPAPAKFSPHRFPAIAKARRDRVLRTMGELYSYDVAAALKEPVRVVTPKPLPELHPSYASAVRAWLTDKFPLEQVYGGGWRVETGLDAIAQRETEALFPKKLALYQTLVPRRGALPLQAAAVAMDVDTGLLTSIYGGTDSTLTGFNRATQARRQAGSSFKPLVYALAFEQRDANGAPKFTAASIEPNAPRVFQTPEGPWSPRNVGGEYTATASLAYALAWSQNVATASLLQDAGGPGALVGLAKRFGLATEKYPKEMGLALGQAEVTIPEMAQVAAVLANGGLRVAPRPVFRAVDAGGVERVSPPVPLERALDAQAATLTRDLMRGVVDSGTGGAARGAGGEPGYAGPVMGKTGTTDGEKDLWFIGATPKRAAAVWLGYDTPTSIGASASDLAAPLWGWWMRKLTAGDGKPADFANVAKLERRAICTVTGLRANDTCKALSPSFVPGTAPKGICPHDHQLEAEAALEDNADESAPARPQHESLWKRLEREQSQASPDAPAAESSEETPEFEDVL